MMHIAKTKNGCRKKAVGEKIEILWSRPAKKQSAKNIIQITMSGKKKRGRRKTLWIYYIIVDRSSFKKNVLRR